MVVKQPKFTRVEEPTLLCNQVRYEQMSRQMSGDCNRPSTPVGASRLRQREIEAFHKTVTADLLSTVTQVTGNPNKSDGMRRPVSWRDAIRSQCSTCSRHKEKETGDEED